MAFTLTQLNLLDQSIAQGALTVEYSDKKVTYRSLAEMIELRNLMALELGLKSTTDNRTYGEFNKGLQ